MDAPAPPGKSAARRQTGRREKLTGLPEDKAGSGFAQGCTHPATRTERLPDGSWHYAWLTCVACGRFLRWLPRPETIERERVNAFKLAKLAMCEGLSKWERSFVHHVSQQRKLSPKQQQIIDRLAVQDLEAQT
jgi:hypothetical protein